MNNQPTLLETLNQEAINQNIKTVSDFFRMEGKETNVHFSERIAEIRKVMKLHYFDEGKDRTELHDLLFDLKQLEKLVTGLNNPLEWSSNDDDFSDIDLSQYLPAKKKKS